MPPLEEMMQISAERCCGDSLSIFWIILLVVAAMLAMAFASQSSKSTETPALDKAIDKIFTQLEAEAHRWDRPESVPALQEARLKVLSLLRDRKLLDK